MRFLRHLGRLLREFGGFAWESNAWWIVPIVIVLLLVAAILVSAPAVTPFIYTLY